MVRKKGTSGRSRPMTPSSRLLRSLDRVNQRLNILDRQNEYNSYSSKKLLRVLQGDRGVKYVRNKSQKIKIDTAKLNASQVRYYTKLFNQFLDAATSTPTGIEKTRTKARESLKDSLGQMLDKDITNEDVDDFYTIVADGDFRYLADKIGDSDVYLLIEDAREQGYSKVTFISTLENYMTVNTKEVRDKAGRLYDKFIKKD